MREALFRKQCEGRLQNAFPCRLTLRNALYRHGIPPEIDEILERDFAAVREKVQKAVDSCPKTVTIEQAREQVRQFGF